MLELEKPRGGLRTLLRTPWMGAIWQFVFRMAHESPTLMPASIALAAANATPMGLDAAG